MPQLRAYILIVGRKDDGTPYRALSPYRVPIPGLTDNFEALSNAQIKQARRFLDSERKLMETAATDLEAEAYRRLELVT